MLIVSELTVYAQIGEVKVEVGRYVTHTVTNASASSNQIVFRLDSKIGKIERLTESDTFEVVKKELPFLDYYYADCKDLWLFRPSQKEEEKVFKLFAQVKIHKVDYTNVSVYTVIADINTNLANYCKEQGGETWPIISPNFSYGEGDDNESITFQAQDVSLLELFSELVMDSSRKLRLSGDNLFIDKTFDGNRFMNSGLPSRFILKNLTNGKGAVTETVLLDTVVGTIWRYDHEKKLFIYMEEKGGNSSDARISKPQ